MQVVLTPWFGFGYNLRPMRSLGAQTRRSGTVLKDGRNPITGKYTVAEAEFEYDT